LDDLLGKISNFCFSYHETWDGTMERMTES